MNHAYDSNSKLAEQLVETSDQIRHRYPERADVVMEAAVRFRQLGDPPSVPADSAWQPENCTYDPSYPHATTEAVTSFTDRELLVIGMGLAALYQHQRPETAELLRKIIEAVDQAVTRTR